MFKRYGWILVVLVLAGAAFGVYRWQAGKAPPEVQYRTVPVERRKIVARVTASGTLQATVTVQVGAQVSGRVAKLNADYNSTVKKGELIAKLDPQLFQAALEQARANYASAKASVTRAQAQQRDAEAVLKRTKALSDQSLASGAELQTAETAVSVAAAGTDVARAALEQSSAALHQAQVNLSFTDIFSPIDGVVISRSVDVGQTVAASLQAPVLFTIAEDLRKMQVHTNVAEGDVGRIQPGMTTSFTVDAFPGTRFRGVVHEIRNAPQTVQNVVTYDAVIDVENADLKLRPGMTATVTIVFAEKEDVLVVSNAALRFRPPKSAVSSAPSSPAPSSRATTSSVAGPTGSAAPDGSGRRGRRPSSDPAAPPGRSDVRQVWVLRGTNIEPASVETGLSDGSVSEIVGGTLAEGDSIVVDTLSPGGGAGSSGAPPRMGRMF